MKITLEVVASKQFEFNGKKFVSLEGFANGYGIMKTTVAENLVPDSLEGKMINLEFEIGLSNYKPVLKVKGLQLLDNIID